MERKISETTTIRYPEGRTRYALPASLLLRMFPEGEQYGNLFNTGTGMVVPLAELTEWYDNEPEYMGTENALWEVSGWADVIS